MCKTFKTDYLVYWESSILMLLFWFFQMENKQKHDSHMISNVNIVQRFCKRTPVSLQYRASTPEQEPKLLSVRDDVKG